jgi:hypothetical protein
VALTKFEVASAALVMIGANPVGSFTATSTEALACAHLYQPCVDHWLSLYPWRFASRTEQLGRAPTPPLSTWQASYVEPANCISVQALRTGASGVDIPFDRFENTIQCNAGTSENVFCVFTREPPIAFWPGYFTALIEVALAAKLAFPLSAKLDLQDGLTKQIDAYFRLAKNADSRQQTSRKFRVGGRRSILEARRA